MMIKAFFENETYVNLFKQLLDTTFFSVEAKNMAYKILGGKEEIFFTLPENTIYKRELEPVMREMLSDIYCPQQHSITVDNYISFKINSCPTCIAMTKKAAKIKK